MLFHFESYVGSGTPVLGKALDKNQGAQAQQKTASRRGLGNGHNITLFTTGTIHKLNGCGTRAHRASQTHRHDRHLQFLHFHIPFVPSLLWLTFFSGFLRGPFEYLSNSSFVFLISFLRGLFLNPGCL
jgi:hypothetical protein